MQVRKNSLLAFSEDNAAHNHTMFGFKFTFLNVLYHPIKSNNNSNLVPLFCILVLKLSSSCQEFSNSGDSCGKGSQNFWNSSYKEKTVWSVFLCYLSVSYDYALKVMFDIFWYFDYQF